LKRLLLQAQPHSVLAQLAGGEIELEESKARNSLGVIVLKTGHETATDA
jgi:hypothetical protein